MRIIELIDINVNGEITKPKSLGYIKTNKTDEEIKKIIDFIHTDEKYANDASCWYDIIPEMVGEPINMGIERVEIYL